MAKSVIRIAVLGKLKVEQDLRDAEQEAQRSLRAELKDLTRRIGAIYQQHAPGRLGRHLSARPDVGRGSFGYVITVDARDPRTGYDFLGVTRFGHRRKRIYPKKARDLASVVGTQRRRADPSTIAKGSRPALRLEIDGKVLYRSSVRGVRVASDWVQDARAEAQPLIQTSGERLGRKVVSKLV